MTFTELANAHGCGMGTDRSTNRQQLTPEEKDLALLVAGVLDGTITVENPAVLIAQAITLKLIPDFIPVRLANEIATKAALFVFEVPPVNPGGLVSGKANFYYRGLYIVSAVRRLVQAVKGPSKKSTNERMVDALRAEASYFEAHVNASESRDAGRKANEAAAARYNSNILSWNHLRLPNKQHRQSHLNADGKNYDITNPPESTDFMLPGMAPHCDCVPGPPIPGASFVS